MFRRNSSSRLSQSKSTSSVQSKHESIDPHTARQHAHAAAQLAFARAQERSSGDREHRRSQSRSRTDKTSVERQPCSQQAELGEHVIKRQQSVRFAGPGAVQRRQSIPNRLSQPSLKKRDSAATLRPMAMTTNASVPAAYRPPSRSSSIGKTSSDKPTAESFATALAAYDEYYTREPELPSTPSSYRRLRKAKSMISPLRVAAAPRVFYTNGTPDRYTSSIGGGQDDRTLETRNFRPALRAPKSMSFLRGRGGVLQQRNDEAVQMARDRFFHHAAQERLRSQPSFLFRSRAQKNEKTFRKSVRSSSGNSDALPVGSPDQDSVPKDSKFRDKARKASKNLKLTLKRVFGRSKEEPVPVPNQQIDARETHVRSYSGGPNAVENTFVDIPYPDEQELSRVHSRAPSVRTIASDERLRSRAGSVRSVRSHRSQQSDDGSRVTSWTSTAVNTLNSQNAQTMSERERQRLSIINENGTHDSSSSFKRGQVSAYPHVVAAGRGGASKSLPTPVDSARVYSALMKRLDQKSPKTVPITRQSSTESLQSMGCTPRRSATSNRGRQPQKYSTIKRVPHEDSIAEVSSNEGSSQHGHDHHWVKTDAVHSAHAEDVFGYTGSHIHQWRLADPLRAARMRREDKNDVFGGDGPAARQVSQVNSNASTSLVSIQQPSNQTSFYTVPEDYENRTPQEMAIQNEPIVIEPKRLRESRSTFFGGTSIISRTTSPYRRAMAERAHCPAAPGGSPVAARFSIIPNPLYQTSETVDTGNDVTEERVSPRADSESLYSRTTSGHTLAANSALSLLIDARPNTSIHSADDSSTGDAIILERATYRPSMMSSINTHRATSSAGSNDWKSWMSTEVAKLERAKVNRLSQSYVNYALPTMPRSFPVRHVRESAQYDDEDVEVGQGKAAQVKLPLGMIQPPNANIQSATYLKPILKKPSIASLNENSDPRHRSTSTIHIPLPPPIPDRSPLRSTQSRASLRSVNTITPGNSAIKNSSMNGRHVLQKRQPSSTTLRSVKSYQSMETPAKLVKKRGRLAPSSTGPSPSGLGVAIDKQFGTLSTGSRTPVRYVTDCNRLAGEGSEGRCEADGIGLMGQGTGPTWELSESDAQAMGSRKMVELFLNSRRRRIDGCSEEDGGGSGVFL